MSDSLQTPVYYQISQALADEKRLPEKIVVPPDLFAKFAEEVALTRHSQTVWGVPVIAGEVTDITFVRVARLSLGRRLGRWVGQKWAAFWGAC
jgi:hypothetical protein